jgi:antitoxin component YwqK of YwqJK toxin-antitoxin module
MKLNQFLTPEEQLRLSREYVLAHEKLTVLSREYVMEHGVFWDDAGLDWDECGYYTVDRDGVSFTGLTYEVYDHKNMQKYPFWSTDFQDGSLMCYAYYVNGLQDGPDVAFYPAGAVKSYCVYKA